MSEPQTAAPARSGEPQPGNEVVVRRLEEVARLLEIQRADVYRVRAWRSAASRVSAVVGEGGLPLR